MQVTDSELLARFVKEKDDAAFELLVRRHANTVWRVCQGLMWQRQDAEDVFQATFLLLSTKAKQLLKHQSLGGWLHVSAVRIGLKHRRQISQQRETALRHELEGGTAEPWQMISAARDQEALYREIAELPSHYREVIVLCILDGKSRNEVARLLKRTSASVKASLSRGKKLLRQRLLRNGIGRSFTLMTFVATTAGTSGAIGATQMPNSLVASTLQLCCNSHSNVTISLMTQLQVVKSKLFGCNLGWAKGSALAASLIVIALIGGFISTNFSNNSTPQISLGSEQLFQVVHQINITSKPFDELNPQDDAEAEDNFRSSQNAMLERELALIKNEIEIDDFLIHEIRNALRDNLDDAVKRFRESKQATVGHIFGPSLEAQLEKDIWNQVLATVPDDKKEKLNQYIASAVQLNQIRDEHYQNIIIQLLVDLLSLSQEKQSEVETIVSKHWDRNWNLMASMSRSVSGLSTTIIEPLIRDLEKVLTAEQLEIVRNINDYIQLNSFDMINDPKAEGWDNGKLKEKCNRLMDLKLLELHELCDLNAEQKLKFRVAKNGAIAKTITNWNRIRDRLHDEDQDLPDLVMRINLLVPLITPCLTNQCTRQREWNNAIQSVLTPAQREKWKEREKVRQDADKRLMIGQLVYSLGGYQIGFTCDQHQKLVQLLDSHIESVREGNQLEAGYYLDQIPDEKFADILNESQLSQILPTIRLRRELGQFFSPEK